jgi:hypothetical protein
MAPYSTSLCARLATLIACFAALGCQGGPLTLPGDAAPARVHAHSGSGQRGTVGAELRLPLVVRVTDASDRPVRDASVDFSTEPDDAELNRTTTLTDSSGMAEVRVLRLGTVEGIQIVEARLAQDASLRAIFTLTAEPADPPDDDGEGDRGGGDAGGDSGGNGDGDDGQVGGDGDEDGGGNGDGDGNRGGNEEGNGNGNGNNGNGNGNGGGNGGGGGHEDNDDDEGEDDD